MATCGTVVEVINSQCMLSYPGEYASFEQLLRCLFWEVEVIKEVLEVKHVDCHTVMHHELESVTTNYKFKSMMRAPLHGFAFWSDVEFCGPTLAPTNNQAPSLLINNLPVEGQQRKKQANPNEALVLSTAPEDPPTHWQQNVLYFYEPIELEQDQLIEGCVNYDYAQFVSLHSYKFSEVVMPSTFSSSFIFSPEFPSFGKKNSAALCSQKVVM